MLVNIPVTCGIVLCGTKWSFVRYIDVLSAFPHKHSDHVYNLNWQIQLSGSSYWSKVESNPQFFKWNKKKNRHCGGCTFFQNFSCYGLVVMMFWRFGGKGLLNQRLNQWISDEGVCRTAPAIPDVLKSKKYNGQIFCDLQAHLHTFSGFLVNITK